MTESNNLDHPLPRRDFLGLGWRIIGVVAAGQGAYLGLRFLASRKAEGSVGQIVTAGIVSDFPPGTVTPYDAQRFFLVRFEDGGFVALFTRCTHLACAVEWNTGQHEFSCPCHGSIFAQDGAVLNPPAPRPLDRFPVTLDGDKVLVNTGKRVIRRETAPGDILYPPEPPTPTFRPGPQVTQD